MQAKLRVLRGSSAGKDVRLKGPKFLIGRSEECHMRARSDAISRRHCAVLVRQSGIVVRDLGSRNGTFVNGVRIKGDQPLTDGDRLQVGPLEFFVLIELPEAAKANMAAAGAEPERVGDLVNQWLEELDDPEPDDPMLAAMRDTGRYYSDDTEAVTIDPTGEISESPHDDTKIVETPAKEEPEQEPESNETKAKAGKNKSKAEKAGPGKLPKQSERADAPKNTQEAAAQMLRRLMNRR